MSVDSEFFRYVGAGDFGTPAQTSTDSLIVVNPPSTNLNEIAETAIFELAKNDKYAA